MPQRATARESLPTPHPAGNRELVMPYRTDWKWRGDRDIWRDLGHFFLYGQIGGLAAQLVFLAGVASLLGPLQLPSL